MGMRYTPEQLKRLRESPLISRPPGLPPVEEWMGPPSENVRNQSKASHSDRVHLERVKLPLMDQTNRRPGLDRHISRSSANPDDIILGPPKTSFASATSLRNSNKPSDLPDRPPLPRDSDSRDRFSFRKGGDTEDDRGREGRSNNVRAKRTDGDQDSDGWSTVKPRKSFGTDGAERFNGRMGGDRRFKDREERETKDRPPRGFDNFSREKDGDHEQESGTRRNGVGRGRNEPSWFKDSSDPPPLPGDRKSNGERFADRNRGWREKDRDEKVADRGGDRGEERGDRRWDRDRRQEREPEWMDEPEDEKKQAHTQEDFQKWKERMKAGSGGTPAEEAPSKVESNESGGQSSFFGLDKPKVESSLIVDSGPDKFFGLWAQPKQDSESDPAIGSKKEGAAKAKTVGKSSRFTSFFTPQEDPQRRLTEPPPTMPPPVQQESSFQANKEKEDFQKLLQKLQSQSFGAPIPIQSPMGGPQQNPQSQEKQSLLMNLQDSFHQYRPERQEGPRPVTRDSQQALQDLLGQRQTSVSQPSSARPEQMLQELVNQRQNALSQSSSRPEQVPNRNAEYLMGLMQNARAAPEAIRVEQMMLRMPPQQQQPDRQMQQQMADREQEIQREQRERSASQRQRRPELPPGFFDEGSFQRGSQPQHEGNPASRSQAPPQPTQILQRPPPGLDQLPPGWGAPNALPPPLSQQRHIAPPPGLPGGPSRGMPMPQNMFPPAFPLGGGMGGFGPPPEGMVGAPRNMPPPPPGFMMPPPGFMGGPPMNAFQGPEMAYGGPFEGRGASQGNFRRQ